MSRNVPSCEQHEINLAKIIEDDSHTKCLNQNFIEVTCSSKYIYDNTKLATHLFIITLKLQEEKEKDIFSKLIESNFNRTTGVKMIKPIKFKQ